MHSILIAIACIVVSTGVCTGRISSAFGQVTSAEVAPVGEADPPAIRVQPRSQTAVVGELVTLSVVATGAPPLIYQWRFRGRESFAGIQGTISLSPVNTNMAGEYQVVITNCFGAVTSAVAILTVQAEPPVAVAEAWVQRYNNDGAGGADDHALKAAHDAAGNIIVIGTTYDHVSGGTDVVTIKYAGANGALLWRQRYNGPGNGDDCPKALAVDGSGNVVIAAASFNGTNHDYYTAKYAAADGALLWERRYNSPANNDDQPNAVAADGLGNVVVTGYCCNENTSGFIGGFVDFYTAKYASADGSIVWESRYNGPFGRADVAQAAAVDATGNVVVTGYSVTRRETNGYLVSEYYTAKYAAVDGTRLWEASYRGPADKGDIAKAVAVDALGNVVVTGLSSNGTNGYADYYTAKYAATDGALLWEKRYDGPRHGDDYATAVAVDNAGNVVVTGYSAGVATDNDYHTVKYTAADGSLVWEKRYNGPANGPDITTALAVDDAGNVVVTGYSLNGYDEDGYALPIDYYTARYASADGALLWEKRVTGRAHDDPATGLTVDAGGNVVVAGYGDFQTIKYAAAGGIILWESRHDGPGNRHDHANAVTVDHVGNVIVTGISFSGGTRSGYYTAKYAAVTGALLWEKRYDSGWLGAHDEAMAVAVDGDGNVVVTGHSYAANGSTDMYTARYAAADGALLWERRCNGPANNFDQARALAVDNSGNVVVAGFSRYDGIHDDSYTARYAAADGALLWEQRHNHGGNSEQAMAVVLDASGNAVVTGRSDGGAYAAKYAATNGALLWAQRSSSGGRAVAVDSSGNVVVTGEKGTAKYAAADGALLWELRYGSPPHQHVEANAIAVDGSGDVLVAGVDGYSTSTRDFRNFYTAKYAGTDGMLLWEKRYNGPADGADFAEAVALDCGGNVVVSGTSRSGTHSDYYTAKYAGADGALLWQKRYNGPAGGDDQVTTSHCLALGPNGMVALTGASDGDFSSGTTYDYATVVYRESLPPAEAPTALTVEIHGRGRIAPDLNGRLLVPGDCHRLLACPAAGFAFVHWTGGITSGLPSITFTMRSNLVLAATFVDVAPPLVTIAPPDAATPLAAGMFTLAGTAGDNDAVAQVLVQVGDGPFQPAAGTTNWSATVRLQSGINAIRAKAIDSTGNESPVVTRGFLAVASRLALVVEGAGTVRPLTNGQPLVLGRRYTLTATPRPGNLFRHWSGTSSSASPSLTFTAVADTTLTAHFVTNQFPERKGHYTGLMNDPVSPAHENGGWFAFNLSAGGAFSGRLTLAGERFPVSGRFDADQHAHRTIHRGSSLPALEIDLQLGPGPDLVSGTVSAGAVAGELIGYRAPIPGASHPTVFPGRYTMLLSGSMDPAAAPFGQGCATLTVAANGRVALAGALADNTPMAQSVPLSARGGFPFYSSLYRGGGSCFGWVSLLETPTNDIHGRLLWTRPAGLRGRFYRPGFVEETSLLGSRYTATNRPLLHLTNAVVVLEGGNLRMPAHQDALMGMAGEVTLIAPNPYQMALTIAPANGRFHGHFTHPDVDTVRLFRGVLLQNQKSGAGYFLGTNQGGSVYLGPRGN